MAASKAYGKLFAGLFLMLCIALTAGCTTSTVDPPQHSSTMPAGATATKGRAQLWSENCMRCHNMRSPETYSDAQWEVAMHHMRLRADLTGEEHRAILEFLKSSN